MTKSVIKCFCHCVQPMQLISEICTSQCFFEILEYFYRVTISLHRKVYYDPERFPLKIHWKLSCSNFSLTRATTVRSKGRNLRIKAPMCRALKKLCDPDGEHMPAQMLYMYSTYQINKHQCWKCKPWWWWGTGSVGAGFFGNNNGVCTSFHGDSVGAKWGGGAGGRWWRWLIRPAVIQLPCSITVTHQT